MMEKVTEILAGVRRAGRNALLEHEVYAMLSAVGIDVPRFAYWPGEPGSGVPGEVANLLATAPGDVVLKIVSPEILHKSDVGGVAVSGSEPSAVGAAALRVWSDVGRRMPEAVRSGILVVEKVKARSGSPAVRRNWPRHANRPSRPTWPRADSWPT